LSRRIEALDRELQNLHEENQRANEARHIVERINAFTSVVSERGGVQVGKVILDEPDTCAPPLNRSHAAKTRLGAVPCQALVRGWRGVIDGAASNRLLLAILGRTAADRNPFAGSAPSPSRNHRRLTLAALCSIKEWRRRGNQFVSVRSRYPTPSITNAGVPTAPALTAAMISASFSPRYIGLAVMLLWP
jgi:hypothetical protein